MQHWTFLLYDTNTKANITAIVNSAVQPVWLATSYGWYVATYDNIIGFCYSCDHMALCNFGYILRVALAHGLLSSEHLGLRNGDFGELNNSFLCDEEKRVEQHPSKTRHDKVGVHKKWAIEIYFFTSSTYPCIKAPCTLQHMFGWNQTTNQLVPPLSTSNHRRYAGIL